MKRVEDEAKARMRSGVDVGGGEGRWCLWVQQPRVAEEGRGAIEVIRFSLFSEDSELEPV